MGNGGNMTSIQRFRKHPSTPRRCQRGIVLIAALAVLLMLTLLSIGMFRSLGLGGRIARNTREKAHAFAAAQSALQAGESWVASGSATAAVACGGVTTVAQICNTSSSPLPTQQMFYSAPWNFGTTFIPPSVTVNGTTSSQVTTVSGTSGTSAQTQATYLYADPQYYITVLGPDPSNTNATLYQVTALGYGATPSAVAVVQSVYSVGTTNRCITQRC